MTFVVDRICAYPVRLQLCEMLLCAHIVCPRRDSDAWAVDSDPSSGQSTSGNGGSKQGAASALTPTYTFSRTVPADADLSALLCEEAGLRVGASNLVLGLNASADSFYSSQVGCY